MYSSQLLKRGKNTGIKKRITRRAHLHSNTKISIGDKHFKDFPRGGRNLLLEEEKQQTLKDLESVKGSLAIEGLHLTRKEEDLIISNALGQISDDEFDRIVMELIENE